MNRTAALSVPVLLASFLSSGSAAAAPVSAGKAASGGSAPSTAATAATQPSGQLAPARPGLADPNSVLAKGWKNSPDRAVETIGDENGFNVLVADASTGYAWSSVASLSEPGFDTSQWLGQACVTGSGDYAAVVYAPWSFSNNADEFDRDAFTAIVNLTTGAVRKLPQMATLAYYDPGCGTDDRVAFSSVNESNDNTPTSSGIAVYDAASGRRLASSTVPGQVTSAVPYGSSVAAVSGDRVVSIGSSGQVKTLTSTSGVALRLHPDAQGGLGFEVPSGKQVQIHRFVSGKDQKLGTAALGSVEIAGSAGKVYLVGPSSGAIKLGAKPAGGWQALSGTTVDTQPSTQGGLLVSAVSNHVNPQVATTAQAGSKATLAQSAKAVIAAQGKDRIAISATVRATKKAVSFTVDPGTSSAAAAKTADAASPALAAVAATIAGTTSSAAKSSSSVKAGAVVHPATVVGVGSTEDAGSTTNADDPADPSSVTWDPTRGCSVARNDPNIETYQATAQQVEWAADLAVQGELTSNVTRAAGWEGSGIPVSWAPQTMFPLQHLDGPTGSVVPVQILLGVLAQESNTLQASSHAVDAELGNFNQGGFYGSVSTAGSPPDTSWATTDCGYGIGQVTTDMQIGSTERPADGSTSYTIAEEQQAIAADYASNIAATLNMLIDAWNELYTDGILANGGDPQYLENWWFAVWAYNSGIQPTGPSTGNTTGCTPGPTCNDGSGNWGLGWTNNPADPSYPSDRATFSANVPFDTANPQLWSYPEKVLGWATTPLARYNYAAGEWQKAYSAGVWSSSTSTAPDSPSYQEFCVETTDSCERDAATDVNGNVDSAGLCLRADFHCWWNVPDTWQTNCSSFCGKAVVNYNSSSAKPGGTDIYPPDGCTSTTSPADGSDLAAISPPSNAVIVDMRDTAGCGTTPSWTPQGTLSFSFPESAPINGCTSQCITYDGKIDFHQVGIGLGGHLWFTHTQQTASVIGTWTPPSTVTGWTRIMMHIPVGGGVTQQAAYTINTNGPQGTETRYVNQHMNANTWVQLGVFDLGAGATVSLSNKTADGNGDDDIAWDAAAFVPLPSKPTDFVVQLGDSYSSGTAASNYIPNSNTGPYASTSYKAPAPGTANAREWNACLRSEQSWIRDAVLPDDSSSVGSLTDSLASSLDYHSVACNGALTDTVDPDIDDGYSNGGYNYETHSSTVPFGTLGQYNEVSQLDAGYLDDETTLVALTLGGNDANFSGTVQDCAPPNLSCPSDATVQANLTTATNLDQQVLEDIHLLAPNAKIVLLGYPELFDVQSLGASVIPLGSQVQLNTWADDFDSDLSSMVSTLCEAESSGVCADVPVYFDSPISRFVGAQDNDSPTGINDFVSGPASDDLSDFSCPGNPVCPSMESFHPTAIGTARYALALQDALGAIKYDQ